MPRDERTAQLLSVAEEVIALHGFQDASMDEIAERAGVSKPVLYDHFRSKDALLSAVVVRSAGALADHIDTAVDGAQSADDMLRLGIMAYFEFVSRRSQLWSVVITEGAITRETAQAIEMFREQQAVLIAPLLASYLPKIDSQQALDYAHIIIGACERLATRCVFYNSYSPEEATQHLLDVLWLGLSNLRYGARWRPSA